MFHLTKKSRLKRQDFSIWLCAPYFVALSKRFIIAIGECGDFFFSNTAAGDQSFHPLLGDLEGMGIFALFVLIRTESITFLLRRRNKNDRKNKFRVN